MPFARTVVDLIEDMKATCNGKPQIDGPLPTAWETMQMTWESNNELWEFVDFQEVFSYLRGIEALVYST